MQRAAPKLMFPILFCWPTMTEEDIGGTAVGVESSHPLTFTDQRVDVSTVWGALQQW